MKTSIRTTVVSLLAAVALITSTSVAFAQETKTLKEALKYGFYSIANCFIVRRAIAMKQFV